MGIAQTYNLFRASEKAFRCPACHAALALRNENSFVCSNGHCYDLSKYGYANFVPHQKNMKYTKTLFESRRHIFRLGFYDPLVQAIAHTVASHAGAAPFSALDAGCGEGFFISQLVRDGAALRDAFAIDIHKDAVVLAARAGEAKNVKWIVGDLAHVPLQSGTVDVLLNIFSPANYGEFTRLLTPNGIVLKVIPGSQYLIELREHAKNVVNPSYENDRVKRCFQKNLTHIKRQRLFYKVPVDESRLEALMHMTPLLFNVDIDQKQAASAPIKHISIDAEILVGQQKKK